ncbi:MAG: hypothetical protein NTV86_22330 [Planctomycetota bacterium]|nr:hypothetical protein [Planctomycetota bacterium]
MQPCSSLAATMTEMNGASPSSPGEVSVRAVSLRASRPISMCRVTHARAARIESIVRAISRAVMGLAHSRAR